jgi:hypothetical protein
MKNLFFFIFLGSFFTSFAQNNANNLTTAADKVESYSHKSEFIENKGQWGDKAKFFTHSNIGDVWLFDRGIRINASVTELLNTKDDKTEYRTKGHVFDLQFVNSSFNTQNIAPQEEKEGYYNYFIGNDAKYHASNVKRYGHLLQTKLYTNIDAKYYINTNGEFEYDFIVKPGGNPSDIQYEITGVTNILFAESDLCIETEGMGKIYMPKPIAYQIINGIKSDIDIEYVINNKKISFNCSNNYNKRFPLIIDPTFNISYSSYIGGFYETKINSMQVVNDEVYLTGYTNGSVTIPVGGSIFPTTTGAYDQFWNGNQDAYLSRFKSTCNSLVFSTFIGGTGNDVGNDLLVMNGSIIVGGFTFSNNFPISNAMDPSFTGISEGFISCFNSAGTAISSSSFWGGNNIDEVTDLLSYNSNSFYVCGNTASSLNFPISLGSYDNSFNGSLDAFVSKFDYNSNIPTMSTSTYFGAAGHDASYKMAVNHGQIFIVGYAAGGLNVSTNAYDNTFNGVRDGFLAVLSSNLSSLLYCTYIGGSEADECRDIVVATKIIGNTVYRSSYISGFTSSSNFPTTANAYDSSPNTISSLSNGFVLELESNVTLKYSSFFGTGGASGVVTKVNAILFSGYNPTLQKTTLSLVGTNTVNTPTTSTAIQTTNQGGADAFLAQMSYTNAAGSGLIEYSTVLGGAGDDQGEAVGVTNNNCYVVACNVSSPSGFPVAPNLAGFQPQHVNLNQYSGSVSVICAANVPNRYENNFNNEFSIHPNPATDQLSLSGLSEMGIIHKVAVLNINGQSVYEQKIGEEKSEIELNVSQLPKGIYILKVDTENGQEVKKFVKE